MFKTRSLIVAAALTVLASASHAASVKVSFVATVDRVIVDPANSSSLPGLGSGLQQGDIVRGMFTFDPSIGPSSVGASSRFNNVGSISMMTPLDDFTLNAARIDVYDDNPTFGDRLVYDARGAAGQFERRVTFDLRDGTETALGSAVMLPLDIMLDAFQRQRITLSYTAFTQNETRERSSVRLTLQNLEAVPLPPSFALLALPLLGMMGVARRRRRAA